jgi:hypothetical protein
VGRSLHRDLPAPRHHAVLARTDPTVEAVARYTLDTALDPTGDERLASRAGVMRTRAVERRTTLLLVRYRLHLDLPTPAGVRQLVAEEARFLAYEGSTATAQWLDEARVDELLAARPDANLAPHQAVDVLQRLVSGIDELTADLEKGADGLADELLSAHRRVRAGSGAPRRGLAVTAQKPVDVLGTYIYLPAVNAS